ncbi:MAG: rhodanese-like domain-containing protein [Thiofilum sp.]|uniref:rhodanese-like domain-containing protein n=1 Tax=Thiofilum sp. TaxID=2212733 RepID=UPI00260107D8|nr:rhodanese-like domain-containing protein [Thiofilum sp.]
MKNKSIFGVLLSFAIAAQAEPPCPVTVDSTLLMSPSVLFADQPECVRTPAMPEYLRMDQYHRPTPDCVPNGITLTTEQLQQLIKEREPLLIDVMAVLERYEPDFGHEWLPNAPRESLPNAVWLPNVGYGTLQPHIEQYLTIELERLTQGDKAKPIVLFCVADCWMSWNAAQRVKALNYSAVYWYKLGTDGWKEAGLPLVEVKPVPVLK